MAKARARVFIDGQVGTTGLRIRDWLADRADLELLSLDESRRKDPSARREMLEAADLAVLCLPDEAAREAAGAGITIVLEPINTRDMPGFFLTHQAQAHAVCKEVGAPNLKVQFDLYHAQIMEGDLSVKLKQYVTDVGHVQIAGVPDRHEPDEGELNYPHLFALMDTLGYDGWVGCEYRPRAGTSEGLGWLKRWREGQR